MSMLSRRRGWCKVRGWDACARGMRCETTETGLSVAAERRGQSSGCASTSAGDDDAADQAQP
eukprot:2089293-Rhodomonas_salina.1